MTLLVAANGAAISRRLRKQAEAGTQLFRRVRDRPILTSDMWPYPIGSLFNGAAAMVDGETVLLTRHEDPRGISQLTVARSADGYTNWKIEDEPLIADVHGDPTTCWGAEDPRVTHVEELGGWVIAYVGYAPGGPRVMLAFTSDFVTYTEIGSALSPEDKNASLLPDRVGGEYVLFHRPETRVTPGSPVDKYVWVSRSPDLMSWVRDPEPLLVTGEGSGWNSARMGMGPPPVRTRQGNWLCVIHGVKALVSNDIYCGGIVLLDANLKVLRVGPGWVLRPTLQWERVGDVPNVVFPAGLILDPVTRELRLYYGAADLCIGLAVANIDEIEEYLLGLDPEPERSTLYRVA